MKVLLCLAQFVLLAQARFFDNASTAKASTSHTSVPEIPCAYKCLQAYDLISHCQSSLDQYGEGSLEYRNCLCHRAGSNIHAIKDCYECSSPGEYYDLSDEAFFQDISTRCPVPAYSYSSSSSVSKKSRWHRFSRSSTISAMATRQSHLSHSNPHITATSSSFPRPTISRHSSRTSHSSITHAPSFTPKPTRPPFSFPFSIPWHWPSKHTLSSSEFTVSTASVASSVPEGSTLSTVSAASSVSESSSVSPVSSMYTQVSITESTSATSDIVPISQSNSSLTSFSTSTSDILPISQSNSSVTLFSNTSTVATSTTSSATVSETPCAYKCLHAYDLLTYCQDMLDQFGKGSYEYEICLCYPPNMSIYSKNPIKDCYECSMPGDDYSSSDEEFFHSAGNRCAVYEGRCQTDCDYMQLKMNSCDYKSRDRFSSAYQQCLCDHDSMIFPAIKSCASCGGYPDDSADFVSFYKTYTCSTSSSSSVVPTSTST